jgi:Fe-S-cluster containining protein
VIYCLSVHASYTCRHSGACCRAAWDIPVEPAAMAQLDDDLRGHLIPIAANGSAITKRRANGSCALLEERDTACAIHRRHGPSALPTSCRLFPRVILQDPRGTFVTLSHFCPTAAEMLLEDTQVSAIAAPARLVDVGPLEGFDARSTWPPLLGPGVLMDLASYARWETFCVETFANRGLDPWTAAAHVAGAAAAVADAWTPDGAPLASLLDRAFAAAVRPAAREWIGADAAIAAAVPPGLAAPSRPERLDVHLPRALDLVMRYQGAAGRWLASKAFGSWLAYQGDGLTTFARYLRACLDVLIVEAARGLEAARGHGCSTREAMIEAIRRADLLVVHLANSAEIGRRMNTDWIRHR